SRGLVCTGAYARRPWCGAHRGVGGVLRMREVRVARPEAEVTPFAPVRALRCDHRTWCTNAGGPARPAACHRAWTAAGVPANRNPRSGPAGRRATRHTQGATAGARLVEPEGRGHDPMRIADAAARRRRTVSSAAAPNPR